jgi:hypothetical protein
MKWKWREGVYEITCAGIHIHHCFDCGEGGWVGYEMSHALFLVTTVSTESYLTFGVSASAALSRDR